MRKLYLIIFFFIFSFDVTAATLVGWAEMKKNTFSEGSRSPFFSNYWMQPGTQAVQGFSAILPSDQKDVYFFLVDNGAGNKKSAAGWLLRLYKVKINFKTPTDKNENVDIEKFVNFNDKDSRLDFKIQADFSNYYNIDTNNEVDKPIKENRLLTGADFDPESIRVDKDGHFWVGDEFGPFLIHTNQNGTLLEAPIKIPGLNSEDSPYSESINVFTSSGLEGMAINPTGDTLYPMLEKPVIGDDNKTIRIYHFDIKKKTFSPNYYKYRLDSESSGIRDLTSVNEDEFLALEQTLDVGLDAHKKIYIFSKAKLDDDGYVVKRELVDLTKLKDPFDLNEDGNFEFSYAFTTIEDLLIIDKNTLLIANDNNFQEPTDFIKIKLDENLNLDKFLPVKINTEQWRSQWASIYWRGYHSAFGWITVLLYAVAILLSIKNIYLAYKQNTASLIIWLLFAMVILIIGVYRQYNLEVYLTEFLREIFINNGWYKHRREIQVNVIQILTLIAMISIVGFLVFKRHLFMRYKICFTSLLLLVVFKTISMISYHNIDNLLMKMVGIMRSYQGIEITILIILILGLQLESNQKIKQ